MVLAWTAARLRVVEERGVAAGRLIALDVWRRVCDCPRLVDNTKLPFVGVAFRGSHFKITAVTTAFVLWSIVLD